MNFKCCGLSTEDLYNENYSLYILKPFWYQWHYNVAEVFQH